MHKYIVLKQSKTGLRVLQASPFSSALLQQLLRRIPDPSMCLEVTEQSLDQHPSLATSHFLANYLTTHFYGKLTAVRHCEIQALYMGSKVKRTSEYWESMPKGETVGPAPTSEFAHQWFFTCHLWPVLHKIFTLAAHHILAESLRTCHSLTAPPPK